MEKGTVKWFNNAKAFDRGQGAGMNQKFEAVNAIDRNVTDVADANDR